MADGKVVIETDLDSSGIEKGLSAMGKLTKKGLKTAATAITGTTVAIEGIGFAAVKAGSGFEAQMSRVKAISGATGEEFEKLKDQAIKLGAETAFSSGEAAEGMENLASAGFTTNEIIEAMPGLLDMAAASGEDLANSSDIAASTLRGFGLEAEQAGHVADVLAENANRTNAAVSDTGEAMKYAAPLARAAGISFEETAAAIGIMSNAGIKGSQAGTTLRGALSRLSKPTDDMTDAMEELGISFYDSNGKMKSLSEQVGMLQGAFSGMTDEQKNNYLVTLYGQEALSGMLALINEGEGSLSELTKSYENCDGAAKKAADTMQDNLKGAIEQLGGSAESLGIVFYESVSDSLKETAETATESINNITAAFEKGGLDKAVETAGDEFANLAVKAAEHAPDMVDVAIDFVESFTKGIGKNKKKLTGAAGDMAKTLAGGLTDLLPAKLEKPVDKAIDAISDSLNSGGLKKAGKTLVTTFDNLIAAAGNLAEKALPPLTKGLDFAAENLDVIAASATAAFTAFKGYKVITETTGALNKGAKAWKTASDAVDVFNAAQLIAMESGIKSNATLTAGQTVVGLLTGKISLATAAQTAWNAVMNANPIGLVITAVGALAAGLGVYALTQKKATDESYKLAEAQKEALNSCNEFTESLDAEREAREKNVQSIDREYDEYSGLASKLQEITDEKGNVKKGHEDEAKVITGLLADALGLEIELTDGVIQNYQETIDKIKEVIVQKKAEALLNSMQGEMANAYDKTVEALNKYKDAQDAASKADEKVKAATEEAKAAQDRYMASLTSNSSVVEGFSADWAEAKEKVKEAKAAQEEANKTLDNAKTSMGNLATEVNNYNALVDAMATGETAKIETAMSALITSYKGYNEEILSSSQDAREEMYKQAEEYVETMKIAQTGVVEVGDSIYREMVDTAANSIAEFSKLPEGVAQGIKEVGPEASAAMISALAQADLDGKLSKESKGALDSFVNGFNGLDKETKKVWSQVWYGALEGLEGFEDLKDPAEDGVNAFLESLKELLEVHSPSRAVKKIFSQVWPGAVEGLGEGEDEVSRKGKSVISNFFTELGGDKVVQNAKKLGSKVLNFFGIGIEGQKRNIDKSSKEIADSSNAFLGSADTEKTGKQKGDEYNKGVASNKNSINKTSKDIADSSNKQLGSADTRGTGSRKSKEYDNGVGSNRKKIEQTSKDIADSSNERLGSADTQGTGSRKSKEYDLGVGSNKSSIDLTSREIADSSDTLLGSANTQRTGANKSSEYNRGLGSNKGAIDSTSRGLSNTANSGMGSANTRSTGRGLGSEYAGGIGEKASSAKREGQNLANSAEGRYGMRSVSARSAGYDFGSGFGGGVTSAIRVAVRAAADLASQALSMVKSTLSIHSPSRETRKLGKHFGQGFELGIKGEEKNVEKESENLANIALDSLDMSAITERMHEVMAMNTNRVTRQITSQNIHVQHMISDERDRLSDKEVQAIGKAIAEVMNDRMEEFKFVMNGREFGRVVREVKK